VSRSRWEIFVELSADKVFGRSRYAEFGLEYCEI
jgi:hypothetical protein